MRFTRFLKGWDLRSECTRYSTVLYVCYRCIRYTKYTKCVLCILWSMCAPRRSVSSRRLYYCVYIALREVQLSARRARRVVVSPLLAVVDGGEFWKQIEPPNLFFLRYLNMPDKIYSLPHAADEKIFLPPWTSSTPSAQETVEPPRLQRSSLPA